MSTAQKSGETVHRKAHRVGRSWSTAAYGVYETLTRVAALFG